MKFSVLMSVYKKEKPEYLIESLNSILKQTMQPDEIIIVKDGPLNKVLDDILESFVEQNHIVKLFPLEKNKGLGVALKEGILACNNELIARMDTDDIAKPNRFEKQLDYMKVHPETALLGTCIEEFSVDNNNPDSKTILPLYHEDIVNFAKSRNPFRHMTVMFKKSAVLASGNYRHFLWFEDYDLWVRIIAKGFKTANLPDFLVSVRAGKDMFARRGGWQYLKQDLKFQGFLKGAGFISYRRYILNVLIRSGVRLVPNKIRTLFYKMLLRK